MKEINLEEILFSELKKLRSKHKRENYYSDKQIRESPEYEYFINAMKEACKQTLELAAENAEPEFSVDCVIVKGDIFIDKQSILETIKQVK